MLASGNDPIAMGPLVPPEADLALFLLLCDKHGSIHFLTVLFSLVTLIIIRCSELEVLGLLVIGKRSTFLIPNLHKCFILLSWKLLELCAQVQYQFGNLDRT